MGMARKRQKQIGCAMWTKEMLIQEGKGFRKLGGQLRLAPTAKLICLSDTCTAENATWHWPCQYCSHNVFTRKKNPWNMDFNRMKTHGILPHSANFFFFCTNQAWETKRISIFQFSAFFIGVENQWIHLYDVFSRFLYSRGLVNICQC